MISSIVSGTELPQSVCVLLAPERQPSYLLSSPLHLCMADLRRVCALLAVEPETDEPGYSKVVAKHILSELIPRESLIFFDDWLPGGSTDLHVHRLESSGMTDEEKSLKRHQTLPEGLR
jgi:hypothetical protein